MHWGYFIPFSPLPSHSESIIAKNTVVIFDTIEWNITKKPWVFPELYLQNTLTTQYFQENTLAITSI